MAADASDYTLDRLPWFVSRHEEQLSVTAKTLADNDKHSALQDVAIKANTKDISSLTSLMNKVIWALVLLSLTIAGSAAGIALTVGSGG